MVFQLFPYKIQNVNCVILDIVIPIQVNDDQLEFQFLEQVVFLLSQPTGSPNVD